MSKALAATCVSGIVKVGSLPVPTAEILSNGIGESSGVLILDEDEQHYIADTTPDLESTIEGLSATLADITAALTTIGTALTAIGAGMTGPTTAPPPTLAANVSDILAKVVTISAQKVQLDLLKETLK